MAEPFNGLVDIEYLVQVRMTLNQKFTTTKIEISTTMPTEFHEHKTYSDGALVYTLHHTLDHSHLFFIGYNLISVMIE